jgi:hypothetical protein
MTLSRQCREYERPWGTEASLDAVAPSVADDDLVAGSGIAFEDRGQHGLKGVPGLGTCSQSHECDPMTPNGKGLLPMPWIAPMPTPLAIALRTLCEPDPQGTRVNES